jgi:hypothetical protein
METAGIRAGGFFLRADVRGKPLAATVGPCRNARTPNAHHEPAAPRAAVVAEKPVTKKAFGKQKITDLGLEPMALPPRHIGRRTMPD